MLVAMFRAVHADRGGRILVTDHPALAFDGAHHVPFADALPLPPDTVVVPIERDAYASERSGRPRHLGAGRLAAAALLPPGYLRTLLPAYADATERPDLAPRPYAAVAADEGGALVVAAQQLDHDATHAAAAYARNEVASRVAEGLRTQPGDRLVRQLARCAREYGCHAAANAFFGRWECALPIAAPSNERAPAVVAAKRDGEAEPSEIAAFHPSTDEVARLAQSHVAAGGTILGFGRACEGEPLLAAREVEEAIARIHAGTRDGTIHLSTNGSVPGGLRRLVAAGLDSLCLRVLAASPAAYEALHGPDGYRFADVRASIRLAADLPIATSMLVPVLPGLFDRPDELAALIALLSDLPEGSALLLRDLHADPLRALALVPDRSAAPLGVARAVERIREELPRLRVGAFVRPLVPTRVPHVP
jgi:pyruvate-formate lyase-activating enzyme